MPFQFTNQPQDDDLTTIAGLTATTGNVVQSVSSAWASQTPAQLKTSLVLVKGDVGLGSVDNTADSAKPVSTAQQTALDLKANLAGPTLTGVPAAPTAAIDTNTTQVATTAFVLAQASAANPLMDGSVAVGTSTRYSRQDHVHASDTSRQATLVSATNIKTVNGSTLLGSGDLTVSGAAQDISTSKLRPAGNESIATYTGVAIPRSYLIASGTSMTIALGGRMRIL